MVLSANSEIVATVMVDFRLTWEFTAQKKSKSTPVRGNCPTPDTKNYIIGQPQFSHQKFKATLTLPRFHDLSTD
jgi:hypothetical protein